MSFATSTDGYLMPRMDDSFDAAAALVLREFMALYESAPKEIRCLLENVALAQQSGRALRANCPEPEEFGTKG